MLSVGDVDGGRLLSVAWDRAPAHIVVDHSLAWSFQPVIKEHKDKDKNSRTPESCPIMLVDVDPGQVLPGPALPHISSTAAGAASGQDKKTGGLDQSGGTSRVERTMRAVRPSHCC